MNKINVHRLSRMAAAGLLTLLILPLCHAQTIRPVLSEYTGTVAKGRIELVNPGVTPLTVIMEPRSFTVSEKGVIAYRPLDKTIQVKLSAMSFRIPPEQSYFVFYEARSEVLPAWFVIYANIGGFRKTSTGVNIRVDLPHTVYLLSKQSAGKSEISVSPLGLTADKAHLAFRVSNNGPSFGRVTASQLTGSKNPSEGGGFPLYPHSARIVELPCKGYAGAKTLILHLKDFKIEEPVREVDMQSCEP